MLGHGTKFGRKKDEAITALLTQRNIDEAARSVGIAPNTLLRWMKEPEFDAAYREAKRAADSIFNHAAKAIEIEEIEARVMRWKQLLPKRARDESYNRSVTSAGERSGACRSGTGGG